MTRKSWTAVDISLLKRLYPDEPTAQVAKLLGVSAEATYHKAKRLGLKKSAAYLASPESCRLRRGDGTGAGTRFRPGNKPWNKGTHFKAGGRSEEARFQPGNRSGRALEIYQPIGAERLSKEGYLQRKVNDALPRQSRWRAVHLLLWESVHGPLPEGCVVIFRDGDKRHITQDNLECVTRAELMRRNSIHNAGPEIARLQQLRGVLIRRIHTLERTA